MKREGGHLIQNKKKTSNRIKNQKGQIAIDFIFALLLCAGLGAILFGMSITLTTVEITQYIAFSSARTMSAGRKNIADQVTAGTEKFNQLAKGKFGGLYKIGWFELGDIIFKTGEGEIADKEATKGTFKEDLDPGSVMMVGASIPLTMNVLSINFPMLGMTGQKEDFTTRVNAMVLREPTQEECYHFFTKRKEALRSSDFSTHPDTDTNSIYTTEDNGC